MTSDGERLSALEVKVEHLERTTNTMSGKVDEMHGVLMQAKGARWLAWVIVFAGGFLAGNIGTFMSFFGHGKP